MTEPNTPNEAQRRDFLANAGKAAVVAPAAALLLAASSIPDKANAAITSSLSHGGGDGALIAFVGAAAAWHKLRGR